MIRVVPAPEPADFDEKVRQPGLRAFERLAHREYGGNREAVPSSEFPDHWRKSLDDLLESYRRICAYLCLYIPRGTGARSVDHMVAKSTAWDQAYEWTNYRLACSLMNSRKGTATTVLDPFDVEDGWFVLELVAFQVLPGDDLDSEVAGAVLATIDRLRLNDDECRGAREEFADEYWSRNIPMDYLERHAPFVARELRRQDRLVAPIDRFDSGANRREAHRGRPIRENCDGIRRSSDGGPHAVTEPE